MFSQGYYLPFSPAFHQVPFQGAFPSTAPGETAVVVPATATEKKKNRWSETEEKILIEVYGENEERLKYKAYSVLVFREIRKFSFHHSSTKLPLRRVSNQSWFLGKNHARLALRIIRNGR